MPQREGPNKQAQFDVEAIAKLLPAKVVERLHKEKENTEPAAPTDSTSQSHNDINNVALTLALCGWTGQSTNGVQLAYCPKCFQRVGLWLYGASLPTSKSVTSITPGDNDNEPMVFDPIDLHREHCPWKNPNTQCALGSLEGLAGWQVLVSLVKGFKRHESKPRERRKSLESLIDAEEGEESPRKSREEIRKEDQVRRGRLQRLKRAFTVNKGDRKNKG